MTTPTPLAETTVAEAIARVSEARQIISLIDGQMDVSFVRYSDLTVLLACARRCEASDKSFRSDRVFELIEAIDVYVDDREVTPDWYVHVGQLTIELRAVARILLDNTIKAEAERDALAKRVGELEESAVAADRVIVAAFGDLASSEAESARLREELANSEARAKEQAGLASRALDREQAALDRVRELERERESLHTLAGAIERIKREADRSDSRGTVPSPISAVALRALARRLVTIADTADEPRPLPSPSQGVGTTGMSNHPDACSERDWEQGSRPECVPESAEHWTTLPSGLGCWAEDSVLRIADTSDPFGAYIMCSDSDRGTVALKVPDFLAARAFGQKVLGWE